MALTRSAMAAIVQNYMDACTAGEVVSIAAFFEPDAVHYFPPGMYNGPFRGAQTIARRWAAAVEKLGSQWTVDAIAVDTETQTAVCEWTHFKVRDHVFLRGTEWYEFSPRGLITEIRAYYASPQDTTLSALELGGFDYVSRGYPIQPTDKSHPVKDS